MAGLLARCLPGGGDRALSGMVRYNQPLRGTFRSPDGALVGAAFISRAWQPPSTSSVHSGELNCVTAASVSMGFAVAREFWPGK